MRVVYQVKKHCAKLKKLVSLLRRDFNPSKCKTWAKMTTARIKLLRNKRESSVRQMRRDVALLLETGQDATARIRVEHVIREQNAMAANEILQLFCERLVNRLSIIAKQKECPGDLKEAVASIIYAGPRCSDIPELMSLRNIFLNKYGKDFVSAATDLRPDSGVNRLLIEKLSALNPKGEVKLKVMKEIAKEYQLAWDPADTESELLRPSTDQVLGGPCTFVSAASLPLKPGATPPYTEAHKPTTRLSGRGSDTTDLNFQDVASAAKAAENSAKNAIAAAQAAAKLAKKGYHDSKHQSFDASGSDQINRSNASVPSEMYHRTQSLGTPNNYPDKASMDEMDDSMTNHGYNVRRVHSDIKFDDSDSDESDTEQPPCNLYQPSLKHASFNSKPGVAPSVHPKLPDYDVLSARFEELKYRKT